MLDTTPFVPLTPTPGATMPPRTPLLRGTLDLMILKTLSLGPKHGFGIVRTLEDATDGVFFVEEGSLYPALHRLKRKGFLRSYWGTSMQRRAKFYELTEEGHQALASELEQWETIRVSVAKVLALRPAAGSR